MTNSTNDPQKLLILGCGDIGQRLAQQLAPHNYRVTGLRRSPCADLPYLQYRQGDAGEAACLDGLVGEGFDVILLTMTPAERSDEGYKRAYVDSCRQLVASLARQQHRPRLLLFVSSTSVYGQDDGSWVDEASPTCPTSFSGRRLLEAEHQLQQGAANLGIASCIVRPSGIYGPGRQRLLEQVRAGLASAGSHYTNRIHADDLAGALAHLIERQRQLPLAPLYLASDSAPAPMAEVVAWLAQQMGLGDYPAAGAQGERGNKRICNRRLLDAGYRLRYPDYRAGYTELLQQPAARDKEPD